MEGYSDFGFLPPILWILYSTPSSQALRAVNSVSCLSYCKLIPNCTIIVSSIHCCCHSRHALYPGFLLFSFGNKLVIRLDRSQKNSCTRPIWHDLLLQKIRSLHDLLETLNIAWAANGKQMVLLATSCIRIINFTTHNNKSETLFTTKDNNKRETQQHLDTTT